MTRCILNVAVGGWYPKGQERLLASLRQVGYTEATLVWTGVFPPGSPTHDQVPYAFKSYAFDQAIAAGYRTLLWLDASCWAIKPLEPLFEEIEREGHCFSEEGWWAGQWLKDEALTTLGVTRDQALAMPLLGGMFMGISLEHERSRTWMQEFKRICQDQHTLVGPFRNVNGSVSPDTRCLGHVADQAIASVLAHQLGMKITRPPLWRDWAKPIPDPSTVIFAQGM